MVGVTDITVFGRHLGIPMTPIQLDIQSLVERVQHELIEMVPIPVTHHDAEDLASSTHPEAVLGRTFNLYALRSRTSLESP